MNRSIKWREELSSTKYAESVIHKPETLNIVQSWYLLGPVTRFQIVGEHHDYEFAQQPIYAVRTSGDTLNPTAEELKVFHAKTVRIRNRSLIVVYSHATIYRAKKSAAISLQPVCSSPPLAMMPLAFTSSSLRSRSSWQRWTLPDCLISAASNTKAASIGRPCMYDPQVTTGTNLLIFLIQG